MIDFKKHLNCPECKKSPPYCNEYRKEVNAVLDSACHIKLIDTWLKNFNCQD